nr:DDE-type integrase/transposase/recombinase [Streptomyces sp. WAC05858]
MKIGGVRQYLWPAVDQDGNVLDILVQSRRNANAARRFMAKLMKKRRRVPSDLTVLPTPTPLAHRRRIPHRDAPPLRNPERHHRHHRHAPPHPEPQAEPAPPHPDTPSTSHHTNNLTTPFRSSATGLCPSGGLSLCSLS